MLQRFLGILVFLTPVVAYTQDDSPLASLEMDTVELAEVVIRGIPLEKYAAGSAIRTYELQDETENHGTLSDLLNENSPIYLKQYGSGMLSTISMRGMTASQTAVLWNGININSLTLGNFDFSLAPLAALNRVEAHYGSASALYGSDAIGGAIHLFSSTEWKEGFSGTVRQQAGSFGAFFTEADVNYGSGSFSGRTTIYHKIAENDFPFINRAVRGAPKHRQQNAAFRYYGLVQQLGYRINTRQSLSLSAWSNFNYREIQPNMPANEFPGNYEDILDRNFRLSADYDNETKFGYFNIKAGFVRDYQLHDELYKFASSRYITSFLYEKEMSEKLGIKAGADWTYIDADVESYGKDVRENRNDVFLSLNIKPFSWWKSTVSIRKTIIAGYPSPFTPAWGNNFTLIDRAGFRLQSRLLFSSGYRIPTLNDRFWPESGNPDLKPEESFSAEAGLAITKTGSGSEFQVETTFYVMDVDNMVVWKPGGVLWEPENVREVASKGIETHVEYNRTFNSRVSFRVSGNYAFVRSLNKAENSNDANVNNQLPYTPVHSANLSVSVRYKKWEGGVRNNYTGPRFTRPNNADRLSGFLVTDLFTSREFLLKTIPVQLSLSVNNILNMEYQNYESKAMPGINYMAGVKVEF